MIDTKFGQFIKSSRQNMNLSIRKFAAKIDISFTYLARIEKGDYPPPSKTVLKNMAKAFSIHSDDIMSKAGKVPSDIIAGLLEFPEAIKHNRNYFKTERAKNTPNTPIDIKELQEKIHKSGEGYVGTDYSHTVTLK